MKKLLIIKTGTSYPSILERYGDFDEQIIRAIGKPKSDVAVCPVYEQTQLPHWTDISGAIITGSHSMVTDHSEWSLYVTEWLQKAYNAVPILGICYGHQLLAKAFGGIVNYHPGGVEQGGAPIRLTEAGKKDPLLGVLPERFPAFVAHSQTVLELPPNARLLAENDFEPHHAFALGDKTWGVQFHPEFTADIAHAYIDEGKGYLQAKGCEIYELHRSVPEHSSAKRLLERFVELLENE